MKRKTLLNRLALTLSRFDTEHYKFGAKLYPVTMCGWEWAREVENNREWFIEKFGKKPITREDWLAERERLIAKPSWNDAPEWATHLEQLSTGWWCWSKRDPVRYVMDGIVDKSLKIGGGKIPAGHDYTKTLEARPAHSAIQLTGYATTMGDYVAFKNAGWLAERERLIAKPSWNDAPEWATHLEQCDNGWWRWSKRINDEVVKWMVQGGGKIPAGHDYTKTLEPRPTIKGRPFQVTPTSTIHTVLHDIKMEWRDTVEAWQVVDALHAAGYRKDVPPKAPPHG